MTNGADIKGKQVKKWYKNNAAIVLALLFFFPLGIFLMWKYSNWNNKVKWGLTIILAFFVFSSMNSSNTSQSQNPSNDTVVTPTTKPRPVAKKDIVITSMIVKKVAPNTYRYFFNIANNDKEDFKGDVFIQLYNQHETPMPLIFGGGNKSFSDSPVQAGANSVTYLDDSHAPAAVDGIDGAGTFSYNVSINDSDVASGKDDISGQYENDLQY